MPERDDEFLALASQCSGGPEHGDETLKAVSDSGAVRLVREHPRGLVDRVEALDGRLDLDSPTGAGMCIRAEIPCGEREHQPRGR